MNFVRHQKWALAILFAARVPLCAFAQSATNQAAPPRTNALVRRPADPAFVARAQENAAVRFLTNDFGNLSLSRQQLLERAEEYLTKYPEGPHFNEVSQMAATLRLMISEDEGHSNLSPADLAKLPLTNRVAELLFQLRDLSNGDKRGFSDIYTDSQGSSNTPASQLGAIGYPAVPQLIDALTNRNFTRYLVYNWDHSELPPTLLTVDDCCFRILQRISGQRFWDHRGAATLAKERNLPAVLAEIQAWYANLQKSGEKESLIQQTALGNETSAQMLATRYPAAGLEPMMEHILAVKAMSYAEAEDYIRTKWSIAGTIPDQRVRSQIWASEASRSRYLKILSESDIQDPRLIKFFTKELREAPDFPSRLQAATGLRRRNQMEGVSAMIKEWPAVVKRQGSKEKPDFQAQIDFSELIAFLGDSGSADAIKLLAVNMPQLGRIVLEDAAPNLGSPQTAGKPALPPATLAAVEDLFASALSETGPAPDQRLCDTASARLAGAWPDRYHYTTGGSIRLHERERIENVNVWRAGRHDSPLPLPPEPTNHVAEADALKITVIEWATNSAKPSEAFVAKMDAFKDKLLTFELFKGPFDDFRKAPEPGSIGLELLALKYEDLSGVTLQIRLIPEPRSDPRYSFFAEKVSIVGTNGAHVEGMRMGYAGLEFPFEQAARRALAVGPTVPFIIQASVTPATSPALLR